MIALRTVGLNRLTLTALVAVGVALCLNAAAQDATNSQPSIPQRGIIREIKEDLTGSLEQFAPKRALQDLDNQAHKRSPLGPPLSDQQKKHIQDNREWIFKDLNDLNNPPSLENLLGIPKYSRDGRDLNKMSPMERYYDELDQRKAAGSVDSGDTVTLMPGSFGMSGSNAFGSMGFSPTLGLGMNPAFPLSLGATNGQQTLRAFGYTPATATAADLAAERDRQQRLQEFKHLLDPSLPETITRGTFSSPLDSLVNSGTPATPPAGLTRYPASAPTIPSGFNPSLANSTAVPNAFARTPSAVGTWGAPAAATYSRASLFPSSPTSVRKPIAIDPFKDNLPKRAF